MRRPRPVFLLAATALAAVVVLATPAAELRARDDGHVIEKDIIYGRAGETELALDLVRPDAGEGPFPGIVFIHGGGWRAGQRGSFRALAIQAAKRGYVAVTVSYRLTNVRYDDGRAKHPFPAAVHDVKAAVRWLRKNAAKYKVDSERIGVSGGSAGGHLALMVGVTDADDGLEGESGNAGESSRVKAVVNIFGVTDMVAGWDETVGGKPIVELFLGGPPEERAEAYRASSPVTYLDEGDPPILTMHGDKDTLVPPSQARILAEKCKEAGVEHELFVMEGAGHGFGRHTREAIQRLFEFFDRHLENESK